MVSKIIYGSLCGITEMYMWGNNLVGYLSLKEVPLEEIASFIIHCMEFGNVSSSCKCVKEFLDPFVDACA